LKEHGIIEILEGVLSREWCFEVRIIVNIGIGISNNKISILVVRVIDLRVVMRVLLCFHYLRIIIIFS
jgi:hypothetical protein